MDNTLSALGSTPSSSRLFSLFATEQTSMLVERLQRKLKEVRACAPAVGIDLGTTFSCVSVYRMGRPEIIANKDGERLTPSMVYFDPKSGKVSVGQTADDLSPRCPSNLVFDAKRFIGRKYKDAAISKYMKSKETSFSLVRGEDDQAAFEVEILRKKVTKKPEEVSAEILKYLKCIASEYVGGEVKEAVVSVPAYFSNAQRKATKKAAELAGLKVLKLITEPTAAAIHYVSDKEKRTSNLLVFDFGGGTLDVSLINVRKNKFEVKVVYGDTLLGGRNIDENLFIHFREKFLQSRSIVPMTRRDNRRLRNMCVNLKKKLSTMEEYSLDLDFYSGTESDFTISMTRDEFDDLNKKIFERAQDIVKLCLNDVGLIEEDIDEVILVGGSTRIPNIRKMLVNYFGKSKIKTDLNPDEAVAAGASIHAALLTGQYQDLERYKVTEVTPMSLGLIGDGELMTTFIPKNSPLPAESSQTFITVNNDQKSLLFRICEGERKNAVYNNKLGEFRISELPPGRAGDVSFLVKFNLDEDGILNVTASEESTGKSNKLVVTMGQFRWSDKKIKASIEEAKKHKYEDDAFEKFIQLRLKLQKRCRHILYDLKKISSEADQIFVEETCKEFLTLVKELSYTDIDRLEAKFAVFYDSISDILKKNSMLQVE